MKQGARPSLEESYAKATLTSDLGLPHGDGAGAQGVLAAAAWTEVHMGSALRRLRTQWESSRPRKKLPRPVSVLRAGGMTKEQAKRQHNRERIAFALTYHRERRSLAIRIPEYEQALEQLYARAVTTGMEEPSKASTVLDRWLEDQADEPRDPDEWLLWRYLQDCLNRARAALQQGMQGHTAHERTD